MPITLYFFPIFSLQSKRRTKTVLRSVSPTWNQTFMYTLKNQKVSYMCDALRDLVPVLHFKKREKHPWRSVNFSCRLQLATVLKLTLLHGCFSRF